MTSIKAKEYLLQGICELAIVNADINDDLLEEKNIYEEKFFCSDFTGQNNNNFDDIIIKLLNLYFSQILMNFSHFTDESKMV